ncbi:hypothetical protein [Nocardia acidivorans]|uniref:hypothetical protein n=1 Tax=Nocardia acidivorans TaxID=404580 RepID=UPI000AAADA52|nr:hypothetical protein [Nocardia acidivorans]
MSSGRLRGSLLCDGESGGQALHMQGAGAIAVLGRHGQRRLQRGGARGRGGDYTRTVYKPLLADRQPLIPGQPTPWTWRSTPWTRYPSPDIACA